MFIDQDLLDFEAAFSGNTRFFYRISLLWTDCSQERVSEQKNIGERSRHEQAVAVFRKTAITHLAKAKHSRTHAHFHDAQSR